ncbi:phosphoglucomutase [Tetragenococcus halophilus subsp. halophilus]|uniref:phospho-sugar mutase n=1 Tax=Tetragenococcus halophilus TaxID=51669 RepID=UPI000CC63BF5|nr:phospho-sugar mutase [Tetragenococcus halophilus]NWO00162.1 phospho-sugar mutase [Tetragenococcus halophilus]WJS82868.1 phospho-sugar mutase [Tetragenococcus halophilus]GBD82951.1 phosphoglucomutase [Tetragenococcus halophilus subsp. halophilus]GMG63204.1 phospho-sugar mutase [Tetragenococcus halophilus]GMG67611.1 phospho-sugar mutase [Tetragenococcus halophilus]
MSWKEIYEQWTNDDALDDHLKTQLDELKEKQEALEDAFYAPLEFGTAGMRGILGPGINRMNIYTVRQATEGLARFMIKQGFDVARRGVAIAYDSRHLSQEFAMEAAKTLAYNNIPSYVFESLRPTPELSFAVRYLKTFTGIMITASHNPPEYNGYKVYGEDGGQMPPADADMVTTLIREVDNPLTIPVMEEKAAKEQGLITMIGEDIDQAYLSELQAVTIDQDVIDQMGDQLKLIFTPLHGTGKMLGEKALRQAGFKEFIVEPEQAVADPNFSTVKSPNPEESSAFEYSMRLGQKENADLLIATDPDADRLGAAVRMPNGDYKVLSGNQIGALLIHYILEARKKTNALPENAVILKSIVSSELATAIAQSYDVPMVNVLTGFKFIAEKIKEFEAEHSHSFIFGFEESYGFLVQPFVRDKDAIQALVLLAEVAAAYKKQGKTLYDALQEIFVEYGYYAEKTISLTMSGQEGSAKITSLMKSFREQTPTEFAGTKVVQTEDFKQLIRKNAAGTTEKLSTPPSDVLKYTLEDDSWLAIRPSGTEPKIKFYIGVKADSDERAQQKIELLQPAINEITGN